MKKKIEKLIESLEVRIAEHEGIVEGRKYESPNDDIKVFSQGVIIAYKCAIDDLNEIVSK